MQTPSWNGAEVIYLVKGALMAMKAVFAFWTELNIIKRRKTFA